jgi:hypothetical protein
VTRNQSAESATRTNHNGAPPGPELLITAESLPWRQQLGPLGWTVLQHLALSCRSTDRGWAVAVGVRDIAAGLGVTKDTAARAVSALVAAGLVSRGRVPGPGGRQRSGYLLHLPEPMRLIDRPDQLHPSGVEPTGRPRKYISPPIQRTHIPYVETRAGGQRSTARTASNGERAGRPSGRPLDQAFLFDPEQAVPSPMGTADTGEKP